MVTKKIWIAVAVGFFAGWSLTGLAPVAAQGQVAYRVIDENNGGKIEEELNKIVRTNPRCKPVLAIAANGDYGKSKVIVECPN